MFENLKIFWKRWMKIAKIIGNFQALVMFTLFYFLILWPVGLAIRFFSNPLQLKKKTISSNFTSWKHARETLEQARKQY